MVPRENKNNASAKFGGTNKEYYGIFQSGLLVTFVIKPQIWLFYVVVLQTTAQKWTKVKTARAGRAKLLFLPTKYANFVTFSLSQSLSLLYIKHLMTGPKGNSEFCFPETLNVPRGEAEGNIEVEGKQNSLFPEGPVIKCFVIPPNSK